MGPGGVDEYGRGSDGSLVEDETGEGRRLAITTASGIKVILNKDTGKWSAPTRSSMNTAQRKEFDEIQSRLRDIAKAAGVDWGDEEMPARMREMQKRHNEVLTLSHSGHLNLKTLKKYHDWLATMMQEIADEHNDLDRRFKIAQAKARTFTRDRAKASKFQAVAETLMRVDFVRHNKEVDMAKYEMNWLQQSPAWKKAMAFLEENWVKTAKGDWVSKKDLRDDENLSFDDLLNSFKEEDGLVQQQQQQQGGGGKGEL